MEKIVKKISGLDNKQIEKYIESLDISTVNDIKDYLDDVYYNSGEFALSDEKYDIIKDYLLLKGDRVGIGAKLREGDNKVELPLWLGSMDKVKPSDTSTLIKWVSKYPPTKKLDNYLITEKLDGVSGLLRIQNGKYISLYTRGDGETGSDITYLIPHLKSLPKNPTGTFYIRGELIIKRDIFEENYSLDYANARNMVSGLVNAKTLRKGVKDVDFVCYEIIELDSHFQKKPEDTLTFLEKIGFIIPMNRLVETIDVDILSETMIEFKENSIYEIDGIIVQYNREYTRNTSGNPDYAFAFKINLTENQKETVVKNVSWNVSKSGMLKPRVEIDPVKLSGVNITFTTGFNGKYIKDNNIGPGAIINITRSGDVIPFIVGVVKPAKKPQMPDIDYYWNDSGVDIYAKDAGPMLCIKVISHFMTTMGIKQVAISTIAKMYTNGFDNLYKILTATPDELSELEGIKEKSANRIYNNIHEKLENVPLYRLMAASGIFGIGVGTKKLKELIANVPNLLEMYLKKSKKEIVEKINSVEGFSDITTEKIYYGIPFFIKFLQKYKDIITIKKIEMNKSTDILDLSGKKYVFSGFRDKKLEEELENMGANITSSVSKNTTGVIVKNLSENTGKVKKANQLGIPVKLLTDFKSELGID